MKPAEALKAFGRRYGIEALTLDEDGQCALDLDERCRVAIDSHAEGQALVLRIALEVPGELSDAALIGIYRRLLEASLLGQGTRGAVFSLNPEEELIELHRLVPLHDRLEAEDLSQHLDALYGVADQFAAALDLGIVSGDGSR